MPDIGDLPDRIAWIAHASLMHIPRKDWRHGAATFDRQRTQFLQKAMAAWIGARVLSREGFEQHLVGRSASDAAVDSLRAAAEAVRTATTHQDLGDAATHLADAMQRIGLHKWPGFLRDAANQADSDTPPAGNPERWAGQPSVGTGECVPLVQQATGAPRSTLWRPGAQVQGNTGLPAGAAIATFDGNGHYTGHAAIYLGQDAAGIQVIDQWNVRNNDGRISSQHTPQRRTIRFNNPGGGIVDQGEGYRVID